MIIALATGRGRVLRFSAWLPSMWLWVGASLWLATLPAAAVLFYSTGDPTYTTSAPAKTLKNSGWQYQGLWAGFNGTVIGPDCFIGAAVIIIPVFSYNFTASRRTVRDGVERNTQQLAAATVNRIVAALAPVERIPRLAARTLEEGAWDS